MKSSNVDQASTVDMAVAIVHTHIYNLQAITHEMSRQNPDIVFV